MNICIYSWIPQKSMEYPLNIYLCGHGDDTNIIFIQCVRHLYHIIRVHGYSFTPYFKPHHPYVNLISQIVQLNNQLYGLVC